jgi:hypothetical protein
VIELDADDDSMLILLNPCPAREQRCTNLGPWPNPRSLDPGLHLPEVATVQERVLRLVCRRFRWD